MPANVLFSARSELWPVYQPLISTYLREMGIDFDLRRDFPPEEVDYVVYAPNGGLRDFTPFTRLKAVLSLWAGVESIADNPTLTVPLARMVDHGLTQGMTEWVVGHVLRYHLGMDAHIHGLNGDWRQDVPPLASQRQVTILGLGALGEAAARALSALGFQVTGWSRSPKELPGIACLHGPDGLDQALARAEILVLLLPSTAATENTLNTQTLARLPRGARIINPGRSMCSASNRCPAIIPIGDIPMSPSPRISPRKPVPKRQHR
jgi:glyoxylate/hydroxypyruvate reductase A